ncbi:hypothetical protein HK096_002083 [Nowakowskiella sp. JEL0078]|nr:hypothetical protein HK096_002083 [Nowakowskiella sp. JEL0078]
MALDHVLIMRLKNHSESLSQLLSFPNVHILIAKRFYVRPKKFDRIESPDLKTIKQTTLSGSNLIQNSQAVDFLNHNADISSFFEKLANFELNLGNAAKSKSHLNASSILSRLTHRVKSGEELRKFSGIGDGTIRRIDEILETGALKELDEYNRNDSLLSVIQLCRVTGIGPANARNWVKKGIDTLDKLETVKESLTHHQRVGMKYVEEFEKKIPRKDLIKWESLLRESINNLSSQYQFTICGSYRRGCSESNDIDLLMCHEEFDPKDYPEVGTKIDKRSYDYLKTIVDTLKNQNIITDDLSLGRLKFMGVCKFPDEEHGIHRRLDIRFVPKSAFPFGLLYFTGSMLFTIHMRQRAMDLGLKLSEYSLKNLETGKILKLESEKDIFERLAIPWKEPYERNI